MQGHENLLGYRIKSYNLLKVLGRGGFSIVYQAYNDQDGTTVAIKAIPMSLFTNKKIKQLAQTEIKIMRSLRENQNIVKYIDNFKNNKTVFIVMELCENGTLQEQILLKKGFSQDEARQVLMQLINGFKGLHEFNIIHRDFKAANIMIKGDTYKIADLGFAKMLQDKAGLVDTNLGTPVTQAPQVYKGESYGMKADIWSLGVVFYQMIFGRYPYYAETQQEIFQKSKYPPSFKGINLDENTKDFITRCLTFDPAKRMTWSEVYQHKLINERQKVRGFKSMQISNFLNNNKLFYKKQLKVKDPFKQQNISQMQMKEGRKMQKGEISKVKKQNENKKNIDKAINEYKDAYMNYRNNIVFVMKYLIPNACYIQKLQVDHKGYLFTICHCTYQKLTLLETQVKSKVNFLGFKEYFDEFTHSDNYKQLTSIFTDDAQLAYYQTLQYNKDFDKKNIIKVNVEQLIKSSAFQYVNLLTDGLEIIKNQFPRQKLIIMIQALEYLMKDKGKEKYEDFQKYIQTLDFGKAAKVIRDRQVEQLSKLYA